MVPVCPSFDTAVVRLRHRCSGVLVVEHISYDVLETIGLVRIGLFIIRVQAQQLQAMLIRCPIEALLRLFWRTSVGGWHGHVRSRTPMHVLVELSYWAPA